MDQKFEVHARWKRVEGQGKFKQFYFPSQLTGLVTQTDCCGRNDRLDLGD